MVALVRQLTVQVLEELVLARGLTNNGRQFSTVTRGIGSFSTMAGIIRLDLVFSEQMILRCHRTGCPNGGRTAHRHVPPNLSRRGLRTSLVSCPVLGSDDSYFSLTTLVLLPSPLTTFRISCQRTILSSRTCCLRATTRGFSGVASFTLA